MSFISSLSDEDRQKLIQELIHLVGSNSVRPDDACNSSAIPLLESASPESKKETEGKCKQKTLDSWLIKGSRKVDLPIASNGDLCEKSEENSVIGTNAACAVNDTVTAKCDSAVSKININESSSLFVRGTSEENEVSELSYNLRSKRKSTRGNADLKNDLSLKQVTVLRKKSQKKCNSVVNNPVINENKQSMDTVTVPECAENSEQVEFHESSELQENLVEEQNQYSVDSNLCSVAERKRSPKEKLKKKKGSHTEPLKLVIDEIENDYSQTVQKKIQLVPSKLQQEQLVEQQKQCSVDSNSCSIAESKRSPKKKSHKKRKPHSDSLKEVNDETEKNDFQILQNNLHLGHVGEDHCIDSNINESSETLQKSKNIKSGMSKSPIQRIDLVPSELQKVLVEEEHRVSVDSDSCSVAESKKSPKKKSHKKRNLHSGSLKEVNDETEENDSQTLQNKLQLVNVGEDLYANSNINESSETLQKSKNSKSGMSKSAVQCIDLVPSELQKVVAEEEHHISVDSNSCSVAESKKKTKKKSHNKRKPHFNSLKEVNDETEENDSQTLQNELQVVNVGEDLDADSSINEGNETLQKSKSLESEMSKSTMQCVERTSHEKNSHLDININYHAYLELSKACSNLRLNLDEILKEPAIQTLLQRDSTNAVVFIGSYKLASGNIVPVVHTHSNKVLLLESLKK